MSYICESCKKEFTGASGYLYHINNKVCEKYKCLKCDKVCSNNTTYKSHICDKKLLPKTQIQLKSTTIQLKPTINVDELQTNFNNLTFDEYRQICEENLTLKTQVNQPTQINIDKQIYIDKCQINRQYNIIVPPAFLTMDTYENIMKLCPTALDHAVFKTPTNCIMDLIKATNCNPAHPEFNSIMITNKKDGSARVSDGKKFKLVSRQTAITQLIDNKRGLIQKHADKYPEKYGKIAKKMENYLNILEDDEQYKALETEIVYELIGMKDVINTDEWTADLLAYLEANKTTEIVKI